MRGGKTKVCQGCGIEKPTDAYARLTKTNRRTGSGKRPNKRSQICRDCKKRRRWREANWRKRGRICPVCNERRACPEEILYGPHPVCRFCKAERHVAYTRARRRTDPAVRERHRQELREYRRNHPEAAAESCRRWREALKADAERHQEFLDNRRIYMRGYRERQGRPIPPISKERYANGNGKRGYLMGEGRVPADPLKPLIKMWLGDTDLLRWTRTQSHNPDRMLAGIEDLSDRSGVSARRIYAILHDEQENVARDTADKLCTAMAVPMTLVYQEVA